MDKDKISNEETEKTKNSSNQKTMTEWVKMPKCGPAMRPKSSSDELVKIGRSTVVISIPIVTKGKMSVIEYIYDLPSEIVDNTSDESLEVLKKLIRTGTIKQKKCVYCYGVSNICTQEVLNSKLDEFLRKNLGQDKLKKALNCSDSVHELELCFIIIINEVFCTCLLDNQGKGTFPVYDAFYGGI